MDFSILYRVLWQPSKVAKQFDGKIRMEPFIFVLAYNVLSYLWYFTDLIKTPFLLIVRILEGLSVTLLFPALNTVVAFLFIRFIYQVRFSIIQLFSLFIVCGMPYYIEGILIAAFGYKPMTGAGTLIQHSANTSPFIFGMIAMITPFIIWILLLCRSAVNHILNGKERQANLVMASLLIFDMLVSGLWRYLKIKGI